MANIPAKYASKIGLYDVIVQSTSVKVRVVDTLDVISLPISELKSEIGKNMIVGIKVNEKYQSSSFGPQMMILCVKSRCLVIQMYKLKPVPQCLVDFVNDKEICFVGPAMNDTFKRLRSYEKINFAVQYSYIDKYYFPNPTVIDVGDFVAKVLQDPILLSKNRTSSKPIAQEMQSIADKAGVTMEKNTIDLAEKLSIDLFALAFSREEIKLLVADVYASYLIATKLFDSL